MNVLSTFSSVGGLDLGLERAGMRVVAQAEVDPWRRRVLADRFPGIPIYDDVRNVSRELARTGGRGDAGDGLAGEHPGGGGRIEPELPVDLLCGGFPCQDLSVAGKRRGLAGERSGLFFEFARIADEFRPRWLLVENVPGLLSSADGRDMGVVLATLADLGYGLAWRVLDARFFGVPQRRRRVFIVGHSGGEPEPAVRAIGAGGHGDSQARGCSWQGVAGSVGGGVAGPLTRRYGKGVNTTVDDGAVVVSTLQAHKTGGYRVDAEGAAGGQLIAVKDVSHAGRDYDPKHGGDGLGDEAFALDKRGNAGIVAPSAVRRLTPVECERLMSWPDDFTAIDGPDTPDSRRYAACGDGVVSNVAEWLARGMLREAA